MKKTIFVALAIMVIGLVAVSAFGQRWLNEDAEEALENNDYDAFVEATGHDVPEARFDNMVERYQEHEAAEDAIENDDYSAYVEATGREITEEQFEFIVARHDAQEEIESAIESGDYDAWVAAHDDMPDITSIIDPEDWETFLEMHEAMENGDHDTARELAEELGLPDGFGMGHGRAGMGNGIGDDMRGMGNGDHMNQGQGKAFGKV